ncbi:MAG: NAD+ synthase [Chloroflexi bacterium]|nr:NAD+ synthase [Chloroflexota bacterium]MDA1241450.1 NAD+ synthase [Chloroflexota bacterium]MQC25588.1 NAD+ synthase [Chloroflexota bacterium]
MQTLRVALAQINTTIGDFEGNRALMLAAARRAADAGADLVAFPELAVTGYPPEDALLRPAFIADAEASLQQLAADSAGLPVMVVGCLTFDRHLHNSAAILHGGRVVARYHKQRLPNYGVFDEERYFEPGTETLICVIGGVEVGITICEDAWYPGGPVSDAAIAGAKVIVNINASPFHHGKTRGRERMIGTRAADNIVSFAYVNQVGGQDELVFDGNSFVTDATGDLIARGASMAEDLLIADLPVEETVRLQMHDSRLRRMRDGAMAAPVRRVDITPAATAPRSPIAATDLTPPDDLAEVYQALVVGTRDYIRKSGFEHAFVALSGGIDSAIVGAVAVDALGPEHVTGVSLPSRYSSEGSVNDAVDLAERLGIRLVSMAIEPLHHAALDTLALEFGSDDTGTAGENVQSRIRGMLVMALSNHKPRSMVLTTGNKSEYACGYATLYGDMVGGFAVIKDVPKTLVWQLSRYRNTLGEVIPIASIEKPPSAELRPGQLDSDSLPQYEILDPIIQGYVEEDLSLDAIVARGFDEATVRRVIDMVNRNEYKRRQSPPGVKITTRNFGRDRRMPLATRYRGY